MQHLTKVLALIGFLISSNLPAPKLTAEELQRTAPQRNISQKLKHGKKVQAAIESANAASAILHKDFSKFQGLPANTTIEESTARQALRSQFKAQTERHAVSDLQGDARKRIEAEQTGQFATFSAPFIVKRGGIIADQQELAKQERERLAREERQKAQAAAARQSVAQQNRDADQQATAHRLKKASERDAAAADSIGRFWWTPGPIVSRTQRKKQIKEINAADQAIIDGIHDFNSSKASRIAHVQYFKDWILGNLGTDAHKYRDAFSIIVSGETGKFIEDFPGYALLTDDIIKRCEKIKISLQTIDPAKLSSNFIIRFVQIKLAERALNNEREHLKSLLRNVIDFVTASSGTINLTYQRAADMDRKSALKLFEEDFERERAKTVRNGLISRIMAALFYKNS